MASRSSRSVQRSIGPANAIPLCRNSDKSLDGKYLGSFNNTIGVFNDAMAVQFYTVNGGKPGHVELHTYPIGIVDHALALRGAGEQLDFLNVVNPATIPVPAGEIYDWTSFSLAADPEDAGKPANCLDYAAGEDGRWVAVPSGNEGEWSVKWQGGKFP